MRNFVSVSDEGTGLQHLMVKTFQRVYIATSHKGQGSLLKYLAIDLVGTYPLIC